MAVMVVDSAVDVHYQSHVSRTLRRIEQIGDARQGDGQGDAGAEHAGQDEDVADVLGEAGARALVRRQGGGERALVDADIFLAHRQDHGIALGHQRSRTDSLERIPVDLQRVEKPRQRGLLAHITQQGQHDLDQPQREQRQDPAVGDQARRGQLVAEVQVLEEPDIGEDTDRDNQRKDDQPEQHARAEVLLVVNHENTLEK